MAVSTDVTLDIIRAQGHAVAKDDAVWIDAAAYKRLPAQAGGTIFAQQGDVYLRKLGDVPADASQIAPYLQLVPGESLGSRHTLDSLDGVQMFLPAQRTPLQGPILVLSQMRHIVHPKHGDICGIPAGAVIAVTYQRLYADDVRRVED